MGSSFETVKTKSPELFTDSVFSDKKNCKIQKELICFGKKTNSELSFTGGCLTDTRYIIYGLSPAEAELITNKLFKFYSAIYGTAKLNRTHDEPHAQDIILACAWDRSVNADFVIFSRLCGKYSYVAWGNQYKGT